MAENNALWNWGNQQKYHTNLQTELDKKLEESDVSKVAMSNSYNDLDNKPISLPANGGNADTVNNLTVKTAVPENAVFTDTIYDDTEVRELISTGDTNTLNSAKEYAEGIISNPNLLINPDFRVNQRGQTEYVATDTSVYSVDRWCIIGTCIPTSTGVSVSSINSSFGYGVFAQKFGKMIYGAVTLSTKVNGNIFRVTGDASNLGNLVISDADGTAIGYVRLNATDSITALEFIIYENCQMNIEWVKLELGSIATPFVPPDPATELVKCQRYYCKQEKINTVSIINTSYANVSANFPTEMRTTPTVTIRSVSGTDNTISYWDFLANAVSDVSVNLASLTSNSFSSIVTNNEFIIDAVYTFGYVADAEIY